MKDIEINNNFEYFAFTDIEDLLKAGMESGNIDMTPPSSDQGSPSPPSGSDSGMSNPPSPYSDDGSSDGKI